ncbi:bifunctional phosphopantothenoylcysteine decarboxylase/phosphopantothenate--cysteine ligase CoaBC [Neosynechococcus sphagnicola]|uniref:bifunctional phosphopantothenoylcysteine decarboxylase/phosphopantothenate--cysteine ligase CoaBC n=1 Tax=Neosynechococcus sphagnicola TaxID=1501145 RepID=UPI00068CCE84|nr:bifunctional phosphopantothenoylcysteine decarboxylase/phosphopantothenate--cysteine ligase CoaBC [Neosynechococcus sphagnicola]
MNIQGRRVLIGITGGIAAYKVCDLVSTLAKLGANVRVLLTRGAEAFITPLTLATLSRQTAFTDADFWQPLPRPLHIELGEWAELLVIAPLTANTLAKLAHGLADNLLTNTVLASTCPILLAPAMNTDMWEQPVVQQNHQRLQTQLRYHWADPEAGILACDRVGTGRMATPTKILAQIQSLLYSQGQRDLANKHLLISAASTREHFDPVRFIGNPATGKMGLALAQAALHRGANVTLVHGPISWEPPQGITAIAITSAAQMRQVMVSQFPTVDWVIMAAAVADVKPRHYSPEKLPKRSLPSTLELELVPDILGELSINKQPHQRLVGFAAQTGEIIPPALAKLQQKHLDAIAANPIDQPDSGFGSEQNQAVFLDRQGRQTTIPLVSKLHLAHALCDFVQTIPDAVGASPALWGN